MNGSYRKWAEQLTEAGIDIKRNSKSVRFIFQQAKERDVHLEFWQVCDAVWFFRCAWLPLQWDRGFESPPGAEFERGG